MNIGKNIKPIPVTIVAGFLGAGKTTLINHILTSDHGKRIGVIVNDFGSINIDAELISNLNEGLLSLANGCICCISRNDLLSAVLQLADTEKGLDHIVIESSGVAKTASLIKTFTTPEIQNDIIFDGIITVADATLLLKLPEDEKELVEEQLTGANLVVLNKIDLISEDELLEVHNRLKRVKPNTQILETTHCKLPVEVLLGLEANVSIDDLEKLGEVKTEHQLDFETWTYESEFPIITDVFREVIYYLPTTVYRVKGFIFFVEKQHVQYLVQMVGRRATITANGDWEDGLPKTRIVFLAKKGTVNFTAIEKILKKGEVVHYD